MVDFRCDFTHGGGYPRVNWREHMVCPVTGLNNRMRAALHIFDLFGNAYPDDPMFIMEQTTPVYSFLKRSYPNLVGAEFLGDAVPLGQDDPRGLRNEDARRLTFADQSLAAVLSFDVFEHVYDFRAALAECFRVLQPGGTLVLSVPFLADTHSHLERAVLCDDGSVKHLLPPEYHGDPLSNAGVLCFWHFGWQLTDDLRCAGFADAYCCLFNDLRMGYAMNQMIFCAQK